MKLHSSSVITSARINGTMRETLSSFVGRPRRFGGEALLLIGGLVCILPSTSTKSVRVTHQRAHALPLVAPPTVREMVVFLLWYLVDAAICRSGDCLMTAVGGN